MYRWMEIDHTGRAFHNTDCGGGTPPAEVHYCDCEGVGAHTYNPETPRDRLHDIHPQTIAADVEEWKALHTSENCRIRRQVFVDLWKHPSVAHFGMRDFSEAYLAGRLLYNEAENSFSVDVSEDALKKV